ncbi:hypothetical protein VTK56DRAFT_2978 [Thermocarpiscus australiensis]
MCPGPRIRDLFSLRTISSNASFPCSFPFSPFPRSPFSFLLFSVITEVSGLAQHSDFLCISLLSIPGLLAILTSTPLASSTQPLAFGFSPQLICLESRSSGLHATRCEATNTILHIPLPSCPTFPPALSSRLLRRFHFPSPDFPYVQPAKNDLH